MAATPVPTVTPNPTIRNHNPLDIIITNRKCRYTSGDSITGKVAISLPDEVIESMEVSLVGLCETEIVTKQSGYRSPNLTSIRSQDKLVDIVKPITHDSTETADGFWPFEFIVPEFTNTLAKYSSQQTSRKFATQRHLLPPSFMQRDSSGNMAQVVYGILARMHRSTRNLEPYTHWVEVKVGTAHEHQEVPSPVRHDLKLVIKRFSRNRTPQTLFAKIRDILCFKTSSVPRICLEPTIFLPDQIIPGHQLPFTILLTPRPQRPADLSKPKVTLNSLKVVLREQTSILKQTSRRCRVDKPLDLGQMQISLEDQYVGIRPLILEQERTQSIFKQLYNIDDSLLPNIKTFSISKTHEITVQADCVCELQYFTLNMTIPVTVLERPVIPESWATCANTPSSFCSSCPTCRHSAANRAAHQLLAGGRLGNIMEWSRESLVTDFAESRPSTEGTASAAARHARRENFGERLSPITESHRHGGLPLQPRPASEGSENTLLPSAADMVPPSASQGGLAPLPPPPTRQLWVNPPPRRSVSVM